MNNGSNFNGKINIMGPNEPIQQSLYTIIIDGIKL